MYLGIDIGTSGVKAVLMDANGQLSAEATAPLTVSRPYPDWSEQDPQDWWEATEAAVLALPADQRAQVKAIGLAGQMHGATLLDAQGNVLRPAILWNDGRSQAQCTTLEERVPDFAGITGNRAMAGFTAPKLLWVAENEPDNFNATAHVLLPKDWLRYAMTGDMASDMSDSAGTVWMDTGARDWSDEVLKASRLTQDNMPRLFEGTEVTGELISDVAKAWGLPVCPVVAGGGDNAAGAVGVGVVAPGQGFLSLGTSGVIFAVTDSYRPNPAQGVHTFCHALPGLWHQMAVILSAASAVDAVAKWLGYASPSDLYTATAERVQVANDAIYVPYLSGERTPHGDPSLRGQIGGLSNSTTREDIAQAALEGVAFALADGFDVLDSPPSRLTVIGGGARSEWWCRILASAIGVSLDIVNESAVGPAFGAARLARLGTSGEDLATVCAAPDVLKTFTPEPELTQALANNRARYHDFTNRMTGA